LGGIQVARFEWNSLLMCRFLFSEIIGQTLSL
jgi:hypothetical protein